MIKPQGREHLAITFGAIAVFAWGFGPLLVRGIDASAPTIVFWRLWLATPVMVGAAYLSGGRVSLPLLRTVFVPGVLFGTSMIVGFTSFQTTSIANATLIGALQPALMLFIGPLLFGDRSGRRQILLAVIALAGIGTVVLGANQSSGASLYGDVLALINLGLWTAYFVRVKQVRNQGVHAGALIAGVFCVAAVIISPWVLLTSDDLGAIHGSDWLLILAMVLVSGLVGHGLMTWAQRHLDITLASLLTLGSPVISAVGAWIVFGQQLSSVQIAGALVVLAALGAIVLEVRSNASVAGLPLTVSAE
ncbi:MAG: DMT family transporter [Actinomycetota bacterium]|nr:DMT family transporter [Actinomycetota bacterium]